MLQVTALEKVISSSGNSQHVNLHKELFLDTFYFLWDRALGHLWCCWGRHQLFQKADPQQDHSFSRALSWGWWVLLGCLGLVCVDSDRREHNGILISFISQLEGQLGSMSCPRWLKAVLQAPPAPLQVTAVTSRCRITFPASSTTGVLHWGKRFCGGWGAFGCDFNVG